MLDAAAARGVPVFACLADLFRPVSAGELLGRAGLGRLRFNRRAARALRGAPVTAYGNHGLAAARSLRDVLGLPARRIVPWEWTRLAPAAPARRTDAPGPVRLLFAGGLSAEKGAGDLAAALSRLAAQGVPVAADIFGDGPERGALAAADSGAGQVRLRGLAPNAEVRRAMAAADIVVVPSRHSYPEGVPNVIFEGLAARAALVVSDHPSFMDRLGDSPAAAVFRGGDPADLARVLGELAVDPARRARMSRAADAALDALYVGTSWYAVIDAFVSDPSDTGGWVAPRSLAAYEAAQAGVGGPARGASDAPRR
jgi:glycosyltransferase involved in cell wall biosynthesis